MISQCPITGIGASGEHRSTRAGWGGRQPRRRKPATVSEDAFEQTRYSLIVRLRDWDDHVSWQTFYDTYKHLIHQVAVHSGLTDEEAHDVLQETVITVAKNIGEFKADRSKGSFKSWLMNTTRWRIMDQFRRRKKFPVAHHDPDPAVPDHMDQLPAQEDLEEVWNREWERHLFEMALTQVRGMVDPWRYQMFDLHYLREWTAARVAKAFGVTENQVFATKYKIERMLKKQIEALSKQSI